MGTCRMGGNNDGTRVADGSGRVWGTENRYLATVGLIPTPPAINPALVRRTRAPQRWRGARMSRVSL